MDNKVTVNIDGKDYEAKAGQTILDVARANGIFIPTLCHYQRTTNVGACRVCVVEVEKARSLVASCCMPVNGGMVIRTNTKAVRAAQRLVIELLWSSGDHNCLTCEQNGNCELQNLVYWLKIEKPRFEIKAPGYALETTSTMIQRDLNKCILCGRCVRAATRSRSMRYWISPNAAIAQKSAPHSTPTISIPFASSAASALMPVPWAPSPSSRRVLPAGPGR